MDGPIQADDCAAMLSWSFERSEPVMELNKIYVAGLISSVEFAREILLLWEKF